VAVPQRGFCFRLPGSLVQRGCWEQIPCFLKSPAVTAFYATCFNNRRAPTVLGWDRNHLQFDTPSRFPVGMEDLTKFTLGMHSPNYPRQLIERDDGGSSLESLTLFTGLSDSIDNLYVKGDCAAALEDALMHCGCMALCCCLEYGSPSH
jgi:hypothetical protein